MTEKTTYQLPPEPAGPVIDRHGRTWTKAGAEWRLPSYIDCLRWGSLLMHHGPLTEPDPEPATPAWPTAPHVWWDGEFWTLDNEGTCQGPGDHWEECHMRNGLTSDIRDKARRFAREAVPVTLVPTEAWEAWLNALPDPANDADDDLVQAVDALAQEVAR